MSEIIKRAITAIVLVTVFCFTYLYSVHGFSLMLFTMWGYIMAVEWPRLVGPLPLSRYLFISLIYPTLPMFLLIYLNEFYRSQSLLIPIMPFLIASTADTFGFLVGRPLGKHKICPEISPGKSWEGCVGSFIGVLLLFRWMGSLMNNERVALWLAQPAHLVIASLCFTIFAFLGGMIFSALKRKQGLKDAGRILPGHGGLLDRFDTILFVVIPWFVLVFLLT